MQKIAVLLLSVDAVLRERWLGIDSKRYQTTQVSTPEQAQQWAQGYKHGLVLVDAALVDLNAAVWQQLFADPDIDVLVGSLNPSDPEGHKMFVAGAKGYFHAYSPLTVMDTMLQQVYEGHIWVGQSLMSRMLSQVSAKLNAQDPAAMMAWQQGLTPREIEVAQRAALGHSNALIADDLHISERTVRAHLSAIFEKLGVADRLMLALKVHGVG